MKRVEVWHVVDDTVAVDVLETDGVVNAKVHADGRGYVKVRGREWLYRQVERIHIDDEDGAQ